MLVRASVHASRPIPTVGRLDADNLGILKNVVALGTIRQRREVRHDAIRRVLEDPRTLDAIIPGLSALPPGAANDRLRAYRYSLRQMGTAPTELRAALVAARVLCWIKLHR
jgi:hypothetical protein